MVDETKPRKRQRPQLRVIFDTNILFTDSASELVRQEVTNLIKDSAYPDLEIQWHIPEMVRHERQYQMQKRALELLPHVEKVEKLLGHNLAINERMLVENVDKVVSERLNELGLLSLALDDSRVDWHSLALDAAYRRPPFKDGETEKGFRDRIIIESFLQLAGDSPRTPKICRIVLVSGDGLVAQTVKTRIAGFTNCAVLASLEELKGLINTLVSQVDESFLDLLKPKAERLFFVAKDETTLFYREKIKAKLSEKFDAELDALPPGATTRTNGRWRISAPNFVKKTGRRIQWTSRIAIEAEASKPVSHSPQIASPLMQPGTTVNAATAYGGTAQLFTSQGTELGAIGRIPLSNLATAGRFVDWQSLPTVYGSFTSVLTHKGIDVYEVLWSTDVTTRRELRKPSIDEITHGEPTWEQVA